MPMLSRSAEVLTPVHGKCRWVMAPCKERGYAVLEINGSAYTLTALRDGTRCYAYRLTSRSGLEYQIPTDVSGCDCADSVFREGRPGGCKHRRALVAALRVLGTEGERRELTY